MKDVPTAELLFDARAEILKADGTFIRVLVELACCTQRLRLLCDASHVIWRWQLSERIQVVPDNIFCLIAAFTSHSPLSLIFLVVQDCAYPAI